MDVQSATAMVVAQQDARTQFMAAKFLKQNAQAEEAVAGLLQAGLASTEKLAAAAGAGKGKLVDVSV
jgi:hypothetical protein